MTIDPSAAWRKSSYSSATGSCVVAVVAAGADTVVTSTVTGVDLRFDAAEWSAFRAGAADGECDFARPGPAT